MSQVTCRDSQGVYARPGGRAVNTVASEAEPRLQALRAEAEAR